MNDHIQIDAYWFDDEGTLVFLELAYIRNGWDVAHTKLIHIQEKESETARGLHQAILAHEIEE
jgi:hypothetical protein